MGRSFLASYLLEEVSIPPIEAWTPWPAVRYPATTRKAPCTYLTGLNMMGLEYFLESFRYILYPSI